MTRGLREILRHTKTLTLLPNSLLTHTHQAELNRAQTEFQRSLSTLARNRPTSLRFSSESSSQISKIARDNIRTSVLMPNSQEGFDIFEQIITDEKVIFTSSWADKSFGIQKLRHFCSNFKTKMELANEGDEDVVVDERDLQDFRDGKSVTQIALNRFFSSEKNQGKLRTIYEEISADAANSGLGYYKFEDQNGALLGGGALAPIPSDDGRKRVDIALHILRPQQGIGTTCISKLLHHAFEEMGVDEVWGSSIIDHPGTPTLCAKHGMIINNVGGMKYYYIDKEMWAVTKSRENKIRDNPISAADHYFAPRSDDFVPKGR